MSFDVIPLRPFEKQLKRLVKKFPSLRVEIAELADQLAESPELGTGIGQACYKIRLAIAAIGGGKSGGGRIITHVRVTRKHR